MKHVKTASQAIVCIFVFFVLVNISDAKAHKFTDEQQDCQNYLVQMNQYLQQDPDGMLNEDQAGAYEKCVTNIEGEIDLDNVSDFILLLDCYDNLMDYYEYVAEDEDKATGYEDKIYAITE
ncbi:MAG: hypothetical protein ABIO55_04555 [Ginsengibacter sp.]